MDHPKDHSLFGLGLPGEGILQTKGIIAVSKGIIAVSKGIIAVSSILFSLLAAQSF